MQFKEVFDAKYNLSERKILREILYKSTQRYLETAYYGGVPEDFVFEVIFTPKIDIEGINGYELTIFDQGMVKSILIKIAVEPGFSTAFGMAGKPYVIGHELGHAFVALYEYFNRNDGKTVDARKRKEILNKSNNVIHAIANRKDTEFLDDLLIEVEYRYKKYIKLKTKFKIFNLGNVYKNHAKIERMIAEEKLKPSGKDPIW